MNKSLNIGMIFGISNIAIDGLSGLLLIPLLLNYLGPETAGLWFLFFSFNSLIFLVQNALNPIVTKLVAQNKDDNTEIYHLNYLTRKIFLISSLLLIFLSLLLFFTYFIKLINNDISETYRNALMAWGLITFGNCFKLFSMKTFFVINGYGILGVDKLAQLIVTICTFSFYWLFLKLDYKILGLALVYFIFSFFQFIFSKLLYKKIIGQYFAINNNFSNIKMIEILKQSLKILILGLVGYIVLNIDVLIVERIYGIEKVPYYHALIKIGSTIIAVSTLINQMLFPLLAREWMEQNFKKVKLYYNLGIFISFSLAAFLSLICLIFAPYFIPIWLGENNYLGNYVFASLLIFTILYVNHNAFASPVIATSNKTFLIPAIINGALTVPFSYFGAIYFGIQGIAIGNIIALVLPSSFVIFKSISHFKSIQKQKSSEVL